MLPIQKQFINYNKSVRTQKPQWIVIHDTSDPNATAQNEHDYFAGGDRQSSADFFVDSNNIIQIIDTDNFYSWAIGDGKGKLGKTNANSCSIEMCLQSNGQPSEATINNTLDLVGVLMVKYNIDINHVIRHYDCSYKCCPRSFSSNGWSKWISFKERLNNGGYTIGWHKSNNYYWWYCTNNKGWYYKDCWQKIDNKWYSFNSNGYARQSAWLKDKGYWYYLKDDCSMACNEWIKVESKWYRFNTEGAMLENKWYQNDKCEWFYLGSDGTMVTGWYSINDKQYYFNKDGVMQSLCVVDGKTLGQDGTIL